MTIISKIFLLKIVLTLTTLMVGFLPVSKAISRDTLLCEKQMSLFIELFDQTFPRDYLFDELIPSNLQLPDMDDQGLFSAKTEALAFIVLSMIVSMTEEANFDECYTSFLWTYLDQPKSAKAIQLALNEISKITVHGPGNSIEKNLTYHKENFWPHFIQGTEYAFYAATVGWGLLALKDMNVKGSFKMGAGLERISLKTATLYGGARKGLSSFNAFLGKLTDSLIAASKNRRNLEANKKQAIEYGTQSIVYVTKKLSNARHNTGQAIKTTGQNINQAANAIEHGSYSTYHYMRLNPIRPYYGALKKWTQKYEFTTNLWRGTGNLLTFSTWMAAGGSTYGPIAYFIYKGGVFDPTDPLALQVQSWHGVNLIKLRCDVLNAKYEIDNAHLSKDNIQTKQSKEWISYYMNHLNDLADLETVLGNAAPIFWNKADITQELKWNQKTKMYSFRNYQIPCPVSPEVSDKISTKTRSLGKDAKPIDAATATTSPNGKETALSAKAANKNANTLKQSDTETAAKTQSKNNQPDPSQTINLSPKTITTKTDSKAINHAPSNDSSTSHQILSKLQEKKINAKKQIILKQSLSRISLDLELLIKSFKKKIRIARYGHINSQLEEFIFNNKIAMKSFSQTLDFRIARFDEDAEFNNMIQLANAVPQNRDLKLYINEISKHGLGSKLSKKQKSSLEYYTQFVSHTYPQYIESSQIIATQIIRALPNFKLFNRYIERFMINYLHDDIGSSLLMLLVSSAIHNEIEKEKETKVIPKIGHFADPLILWAVASGMIEWRNLDYNLVPQHLDELITKFSKEHKNLLLPVVVQPTKTTKAKQDDSIKTSEDLPPPGTTLTKLQKSQATELPEHLHLPFDINELVKTKSFFNLITGYLFPEMAMDSPFSPNKKEPWLPPLNLGIVLPPIVNIPSKAELAAQKEELNWSNDISKWSSTFASQFPKAWIDLDQLTNELFELHNPILVNSFIHRYMNYLRAKDKPLTQLVFFAFMVKVSERIITLTQDEKSLYTHPTDIIFLILRHKPKRALLPNPKDFIGPPDLRKKSIKESKKSIVIRDNPKDLTAPPANQISKPSLDTPPPKHEPQQE